MTKTKMRIATAVTILGLAGLGGWALSADRRQAVQAVAEKPIVRTRVIRRTIHVTKHAKPKHPASAAPPATSPTAGASTAAPAAVSTGSSGSGYAEEPVTTATSGAGSAEPVTTATSGAGGGGGETEAEFEGGGDGEGGGDD